MVEQLLAFVLLLIGVRSPSDLPVVLGEGTQQSTRSSQFGSLSQTASPTIATQIPTENEYIELRKKHDLLEEQRTLASEVYTSKTQKLKTLISDYASSGTTRRYSNAQLNSAITEENNAFMTLIQFGTSQVSVAGKMHMSDMAPLLSKFTDPDRVKKTYAIQSNIVSLMEKRSLTMAAQSMKMLEIIGIAIQQVEEYPKRRNTREFYQAVQHAIDRIAEAKNDLIFLSAKRNFIQLTSKAALKNDVQKVWADTEESLEYTYRTLQRAQYSVSTVIQLQAYAREEPVPAKTKTH